MFVLFAPVALRFATIGPIAPTGVLLRSPGDALGPSPIANCPLIEHHSPMATYLYETTDPKKPTRQFELQQSMKDAPLTAHPETGEPIHRVITGGLGYMATGNAPRHADMQRSMGGGKSGGGCGTGCGCH